MPSDPHVFDEFKLPFIFVPHDAPEPTEWLASHPDHIKLPATFVPSTDGDDGFDRPSGGPPPDERRTVDGLTAPPDPAAPRPATGNTMSSALQTASNEGSARILVADNPVAAYLRANDALATGASNHASGRGAGPGEPTGTVSKADVVSTDRTHAEIV